MSARNPSRRLLQSGGARQSLQQPTSLPLQSQRTLFNFFGSRNKREPNAGATTNPVLDEYLKKKPSRSGPSIVRGDIASSSIFDAERQTQEQEQEDKKEARADGTSGETKIGGLVRNPATMAAVLDPQPAARRAWERKQVIRDVRKGMRLSQPLFIKRTERESSTRSHNIKTSTKKLGMLARQIAGKTVDDAIVQMRFSKKKVAKETLEFLEFARDEAVVRRGMGLGAVAAAAPLDTQKLSRTGNAMVAATAPLDTQNLNQTGNAMVAADASSDTPNLNQTGDAMVLADAPKPAMVASDAPRPAIAKPIEIQLKNGKRHTVDDKSRIYVDQAWVGRGPYGKLPDFRAKGRTNIMFTPWTSISVILKEETTRVREYEEREEKRRRQREKKVWHPLPDRPIVGQRQWFSW